MSQDESNLDPIRVLDCFSLFGAIIPLGKKGSAERTALEAMMGNKMEKVIPDLMDAIRQICMLHPNDFDSYLEFIKQSIEYMRHQTNELPELEWNHDDIDNYLKECHKKFQTQQQVEKIQQAKKENATT